MTDIAGNIEKVRDQIAEAASQAGRPADSVKLMLAAKYQPLENLEAAVAAGVTLFGHNIVQQLVTASTGLAAAGIATTNTVIGPVQSNKMRAAMDHASRIDTVDSVKAATRIARRQAARIADGAPAEPFPILLQVNSADASTQSGCAPAALLEIASEISELELVRIDGLMTIGANTDDLAAIHQSFQLTRELGEQLRKLPGLAGATELSMGMTHDLAIAVAEGSTVVRVGTAVFGPRPRP
ncbi:MAG: YggS family pyridoxal phosphate-dependent enzyme [Trueperella sp.]|nr:YggS family pyridoxal phosphate-dependent enzyme [Trueperella sp.]